MADDAPKPARGRRTPIVFRSRDDGAEAVRRIAAEDFGGNMSAALRELVKLGIAAYQSRKGRK